MILSIITINYNNADGLKRTLDSVASQTCKDFEHIIVDGGSSDGSKEIIVMYSLKFLNRVKWLSEPDNGIYNAMNKGIRMASGQYIQFLNSGDILASEYVVEKMTREISVIQSKMSEPLSIMCGNMIKDYGNGIRKLDNSMVRSCSPESFLFFYNGTLNHDSAYIRRELFEKYGYYNESMKICSDWEWYVRAISIGGEKVHFSNIDVSVFDMSGISESNGKNKDIIKKERRTFIESILPASVISDYDAYSSVVYVYIRLKSHHFWSLVVKIERVLYKFEKWGIIK